MPAFLTFFMPKKLASVCLAFIDLVAGIPSVIFGFIGLTVLVKSICKISEDGSGTVCTGGRYCTGNHASAVCCIDMSGITSKCKTDI